MGEESQSGLTLQCDGAVAVVTVNRPKVLNALNIATLDELAATMRRLQQDETVRCVIVTGAGEKSFIAGADINELTSLSPTQGRDHVRAGQAVLDLDRAARKAGHRRDQWLRARRWMPAGDGVHHRDRRGHGEAGAARDQSRHDPRFRRDPAAVAAGWHGTSPGLLLTGEPITAAEAWRLGLVNRVVPAAELMGEAHRLAAAIAAKAPLAIRYMLEAVRGGVRLPPAEAQALEATLSGLVASTADMREGARAFLEKRAPEFKGR